MLDKPFTGWYNNKAVGKIALKLVLIAARVHPFPYRTRKLSPLALKILGGKLPGKISRCQHSNLYLVYRFFLCLIFLKHRIKALTFLKKYV